MRRVAAKEIGNKDTSQKKPSQCQSGLKAKESLTGGTKLSTSSDSDYQPQPGDVVEFERGGKKCYGLAIVNYATALAIVYTWDGKAGDDAVERYTWDSLSGFGCSFKKIGHIQLDSNGSINDGKRAAKAYFDGQAKPDKPDKPETDGSDELKYKVGDLVEVVSVSMGASKEIVGRVAMIVGARHSINVAIREDYVLGEFWSISRDDIRPLSGTYAERQAKWCEFHGIKKGSKVKIVRKFKRDENGYTASNWDDFKDSNLECVIKVQYVMCDYICIDGSHYPYFALEPIKD